MPRCLLLCCLLLPAALARAEELQIIADADNTLYQHVDGRLGNGSGGFLFAGRTGQAASKALRRMLVHFDLSMIPETALLEDVTLRFSANKSIAVTPQRFSVHRVLSSWSEGETDASLINPPEGQGDIALDGDATWLHRTKPDVLWETPGGDFVRFPSATLSIFGDGLHLFQGAGLVADVEAWRRGDAENHGWIVLGDELEPESAFRFAARNSFDQATRPTLLVNYELSTLPLDCNGDGVVDARDVLCACAGPDGSLGETLDAVGLLAGDLDLDGDVEFDDFLKLAVGFGMAGDYADGDLNCDGRIEFADFLMLAVNFGKRGAGGSQSVPEPGALVLLVLAIVGSRGLRNATSA